MVFQSVRRMWSPTPEVAENKTPGENPMMSDKSALKDFLASIAGMSGDLSNTTAPPFVLDPKSVVEIPAFWAENPAMFISPATSNDPAERALLVLKGYMAGMKSQCYMGHTEEEGVSKPLNAFLGELFIGHWEDEKVGTTYLVSEQVSHHPPITACRVWNPKYGTIAEGYNRQKVTFSWSSMSVHVDSTGFALKSFEKYDEHYLLPLPSFRVKGVLSGAPYPETSDEWYIPSTNGYMSKINFTGGKGFLGGGKKHGFHAVVYREEDGPKKPIYSMEGCWNTEFTIRDERQGQIIETYNVTKSLGKLPELQLPSLEEMSPWESRRAWHDTQTAIRNNDFRGVSAAKTFLEQGQRDMRKDEQRNGTSWQPLFFQNTSSHEIAEKLMSKVPGHDFAQTLEATNGVWAFDSKAFETMERPYRPDIEPDNLKEGEDRVYRNGSRASFQSSRGNTPRASIDQGRPSMDSPIGRGSISSGRRASKMDDKSAVIEAARRAEVNGTKPDVGRQPEHKLVASTTNDQPMPQRSQLGSKEGELDSGIAGLNIQEKVAVEDMLREKFASTT